MTLEQALSASLSGRVVSKAELPSDRVLADVHAQLDHALRRQPTLRLVPSPFPLPYPIEDLDE